MQPRASLDVKKLRMRVYTGAQRYLKYPGVVILDGKY